MTDADLPDGWAEAPLGDLATMSLGKMLDKKQQTGENPTSYLRNINVRWFSFDLDDLAEMDIALYELERVTVQEGDLVVCEGGEPGRCAVWRGEPIAIQKALHRVRPASGISSRYLAYALQWWSTQTRFGDYITGTTIKHIPKERLALLPIRLAPSAEQERIVAELERRLSHVDAATASLSASRRMIERARVATLRSAADGSLTHVAAEDDLADVCTEAGIDFERLEGRPGWVRVKLGSIARVGSGATPKRGTKKYWTDGTIPWVTSGQIVTGVVAAPAELISEAALKETSVKLWPAGTLLVAMYGEGRTRGHCAELLIEATCNQACAAIDLKPEFQGAKDFVKLILQSQYEENRVLGSGGVQENLNLGLIKAITVDLPPTGVRDALVREASRRISLLDAAAASVATSSARAEMLRRSILTTAFSGMLVPQDGTDEPANELLARIRAERESATPAKRTRKSMKAKETVA